ncbi:hypothetical protein Tco_0545881 [Tanacetum coccineum]
MFTNTKPGGLFPFGRLKIIVCDTDGELFEGTLICSFRLLTSSISVRRSCLADSLLFKLRNRDSRRLGLCLFLNVRSARDIRLFEVLTGLAPISLGRGGRGSRVSHSDSEPDVISGAGIDEDSSSLVLAQRVVYPNDLILERVVTPPNGVWTEYEKVGFGKVDKGCMTDGGSKTTVAIKTVGLSILTEPVNFGQKSMMPFQGSTWSPWSLYRILTVWKRGLGGARALILSYTGTGG